MSDKDDKKSQGSVDTQLEKLGSIDESVRAEAVLGLGKVEQPEVIPPLERTAEQDQNIRVRYLARKQVETIRKKAEQGPPVIDLKAANRVRGAGAIDLERFSSSLANEDKRVRLNAVKVAMASRDPRVVEHLVRRAPSERDMDVLSAIIQAVGLLGGKQAIPFVVNYLTRPPAVKVQVASVMALGLIHQVIVYPYIVKALTVKEQSVTKAAYRELKKLGKANLINLMGNMLQSKQDWMKKAAVKAGQLLGRSSRSIRKLLEEHSKTTDPQLKAMLQQALDSFSSAGEPSRVIPGDSLVASIPGFDLGDAVTGQALDGLSSEDRLKALQTFVDNKDTTKVPQIVKWLKAEKDARAMASLVIAVGRLGGSTEIECLASFLSSSDGRVRANGVEGLGMIYERYGDANIPGLLKPLLGDRHNRVKANAIVALRGEAEASEALEQMVYSGSPTYQRSAIYAIMVLRRKEYKPLLDFLVRAKDRMVQKQANEALEFFVDTENVPELAATEELTIKENDEAVLGSPDGELDDVIVNPWDSTLLSEEDAAAFLRKRAKKKEEVSTAADLVEAIASTFVLVSSVCFYIVLAGTVIGLAYGLMIVLTEKDLNAFWAIVTGLMLFLLVGAIEGLIPRPVDGADGGVRITKRDAPKLFALIDKAADQLRVRKPASVLIHPYSEIGLYEVTGTPYIPWSSSPQLRLGMASLRALSVDQLRALIYCEMGRVSAARSQFYLKLIISLSGALHQIHEKLFIQGDARVYINPLFFIATAYRFVFRAVTAKANRKMVIKADELAAKYAGRDTTSAALTKYAISARLFDQDLAEIVQGASKHGQDAAENIYAYYRGFLDGLNEKRLLRLRKEIFKYSPPGDRVFPPLQDRLDSISAAQGADGKPDSVQAATLLTNQVKIERDFSARFINFQTPLLPMGADDGGEEA